MDQSPSGKPCTCPHHKMVPTLIVLIGLAFLLEAVGMISAYTLSVLWPIGLILIGLMKMFKGMCTCCGRAARSGCCGGK